MKAATRLEVEFGCSLSSKDMEKTAMFKLIKLKFSKNFGSGKSATDVKQTFNTEISKIVKRDTIIFLDLKSSKEEYQTTSGFLEELVAAKVSAKEASYSFEEGMLSNLQEQDFLCMYNLCKDKVIFDFKEAFTANNSRGLGIGLEELVKRMKQKSSTFTLDVRLQGHFFYFGNKNLSLRLL